MAWCRAYAAVFLLMVVSACSRSESPVAEPPVNVRPSRPSLTTAVGAGEPDATGQLPDSEPAGMPFASTVAAAMAEVVQPGPVHTRRIYRVAYDQAQKQITMDNADDRLRALERQIDIERQSLR